MSLIVVHLRWDGVGPDQYELFCRALPDGAGRPEGCLARQRRIQGRTVLATDVWIDQGHAGAFLSGLADVLEPAAMGPPQQAAFAVPDAFAVGYGVRPAQTGSAAAAGPAIPPPRSPEPARSSSVPAQART